MAATPSAQKFPSKPIRLVAAGPGGSHCFGARMLAPALSAAFGQKAEIDYKPSSFIPSETVAKATPDGHTLLVSGRALWLMPMMAKDAPFDAFKDFEPVVQTYQGVEVLIVRPDYPVKNVGDLIAIAKSKPGQLKYGSGADGVNNHLANEMFKSMAGVDIQRVRHNNSEERMAAVLSGETDMHFTGLASAAPYLKSGKAKALGVTSIKRTALAPELPTIAESGLPGFQNITIGALFAPAGTPKPIVDQLAAVVTRYLRSAQAKEQFLEDGYEPVGGTPEELAELMKTDSEVISKLMKNIN